MINKQIKRITAIVAVMAAVIVLAGIRTELVLASSASITFSGKNNEVVIGDKASVVVTVESSAMVGDVEVYLSYDPTILEFDKGGSHVSGGEGLLKITDVGSGVEIEKKKYSISFLTLETGASEISVSDRASVFDTNGAEMSVSSNRYTVIVKASETKSGNNSLKTLELSPGKLSPDFHGDTYQYRADVSADTDKIFLSAIPEDAEATVDLEGNTGLKEGKNKVRIRVTAPSGDVREYTITVLRQSPEVTESPIPTASSAPDNQDSFETFTEDGKTYLDIRGRYEIYTAPDDRIPAGYQPRQTDINQLKVTAYVPAENPDPDFILLYARTEAGEEGFYTFDRQENTMQRWQEPVKEVMQTETENTMSEEVYSRKVGQLSIIIGVLSGVAVLLLLMVLRLFMKQKGIRDDDDL